MAISASVPITIIAVCLGSLAASIAAMPFGGSQNPFAYSRLRNSDLYQNWNDFNGLHKRFGLDSHDGLGSRGHGRFVDWSKIISGIASRRGGGFVKKDFGGDQRYVSLGDTGSFRLPKWGYQPNDFKRNADMQELEQ